MPATELRHDVPGISCAHCRAAITEEVSGVPGVTAVEVDLDARTVTAILEEVAVSDEMLRRITQTNKSNGLPPLPK